MCREAGLQDIRHIDLPETQWAKLALELALRPLHGKIALLANAGDTMGVRPQTEVATMRRWRLACKVFDRCADANQEANHFGCKA